MFADSGADKRVFALPVFPDAWLCAAPEDAQMREHGTGA